MRKKDGSEFPPNTLHHIVCGIMRHLRDKSPSLDFFTETDFTQLKKTLDAEMKRLQSLGLGSQRRQAEPLTTEDEEMLWEKGLLGDATPQTLLDTMVFCNGLYFALRSGREHRQLKMNPCQIELVEPCDDRPYTEDISKNRPGGIKGRKIKPKVVYHHANIANPERCFVRLFKKYTQLCPNIQGPFYLQPAVKPTSKCWYTSRPLGHNTLTKTMARLCATAGIEGFKTNHSLRATTATRLYQSGVDEQLVMERTGHRSLEGVRSYKRSSDEQREALSDILNCKVARMDHTQRSSSIPLQSPSTSTTGQPTTPQDPEVAVVAHSPGQHHEEIPSTQLAIQTNTKNSLPGTFNFNSCSTVTLNIHY